ncbi:hypothetical protein C8R44DRAFT_805376 [Mycena epipterygia]|nr:hypothetical protein C8R44DRAFT_805376 [Mycena epipterygia]
MLPTRLLNSVTIAWTIAGLTNPQEFVGQTDLEVKSRHTHGADPGWYPEYVARLLTCPARDAAVLAKRTYHVHQELGPVTR